MAVPTSPEWRFVGRQQELQQLREALGRGRWFFAKITGRRRIGKTTLIKEAIKGAERPVLYVQLPDSGDTGILSVVGDAMETFKVPEDRFPRPRSLSGLAKTIEALVREGYLVVLDEFRYFSRKPVFEFCSYLQAAVDRLGDDAAEVPGGLVVLGSIHTEMVALLEDRTVPLYNRVTDSIDLPHLDIAGVLEILNRYSAWSPESLLSLWALFEGVPKFYRDAFEQGVIDADRKTLLRRLFFESSSPLKSEAETWFLSELRGKSDMILKFLARRPGLRHGELVEAISRTAESQSEKVSSYLKTLVDQYRLVARKQPIFSGPKGRQGRYDIVENFLQSWLGALASQVAARDFRPPEELVAEADERMASVEGFALERLAATLYEERSRKGLGDFPLSERIEGYWDRTGTEIDLVVVSKPLRTIRFASCKRNARKLLLNINKHSEHVERYLEQKPLADGWRAELVGIAPRLDDEQRAVLERSDFVAEDLRDLCTGLLPVRQPDLPSG